MKQERVSLMMGCLFFLGGWDCAVQAKKVAPPHTTSAEDPVQKAQAEAAAMSVVRTVSQRTEEIVTYSGSDAEKKVQFKKLFEEHFNVPAIATHALGFYWTKATNSEKEQYLRLFKEDIVETYYNLLKKYYEKKDNLKKENLLIVRAEASIRNPDECQVFSEARNYENDRKVFLKWRLHKNKVVDVLVDQASMVNAKKREYQDLMRKHDKSVSKFLHGLELKIGHLRKKS